MVLGFCRIVLIFGREWIFRRFRVEVGINYEVFFEFRGEVML